MEEVALETLNVSCSEELHVDLHLEGVPCSIQQWCVQGRPGRLGPVGMTGLATLP
jgi:hypothetical protein